MRKGLRFYEKSMGFYDKMWDIMRKMGLCVKYENS